MIKGAVTIELETTYLRQDIMNDLYESNWILGYINSIFYIVSMNILATRVSWGVSSAAELPTLLATTHETHHETGHETWVAKDS